MGAEIFDDVESALEVFRGRCRARAPFLDRDANGIGHLLGWHEKRNVAERGAFGTIHRRVAEDIDAVGRGFFAEPGGEGYGTRRGVVAKQGEERGAGGRALAQPLVNPERKMRRLRERSFSRH